MQIRCLHGVAVVDSAYIKGAGYSGSDLAIKQTLVRPVFVAPPLGLCFPTPRSLSTPVSGGLLPFQLERPYPPLIISRSGRGRPGCHARILPIEVMGPSRTGRSLAHRGVRFVALFVQIRPTGRHRSFCGMCAIIGADRSATAPTPPPTVASEFARKITTAF